MASLSGVSSSNTMSSLMRSANMISGLASGLDTESMIENLVKSYQTKISQLNQKATKTEWKQEAYRSIITKMVGFSNKYASYTSNTNLMSPSFFSSAVKVLTKGEYADSVSASGKTSSDISLNAVHQLAQAAQYRTKSNMTTSVKDAEGNVINAIAGKEMDLFSTDPTKQMELSNLSGSLTLTYGSKTVSISFDEASTAKEFSSIRDKIAAEKGIDKDKVADADVLAEYINQKLADETIVFNSGNSESADKRIKATANADGRIVLEELGTAKNGVYISGASGNIAKQLGLSDSDLENAKDKKIAVIDTHNIKDADGNKGLTRKLSGIEYLAEKSKAASDAGAKLGMNISLNGSTKTIEMPDVRVVKKDDGTNEYYLNGDKVDEKNFADKYTAALQSKVDDAFGKGKITVDNKGKDGALKLEFKGKNEGDELVINTGVGEALGIGNTATSYLNTSKTLGELLGDKLNSLETVKDKDGNDAYEFKINDVVVGTFTKDSKLSDVMNAINSNEEAGVSVAYSQTTQSFTFKAKETGADSQIKIEGGLAQEMFGVSTAQKTKDFLGLGEGGLKDKRFAIDVDGKTISFQFNSDDGTVRQMLDKVNSYLKSNKIDATASFDQSGSLVLKDSEGNNVDYSAAAGDQIANSLKLTEEQSKEKGYNYTRGKDAVFTVTVNGEQKTMTRSSNSVDIDGLTITMEDTFNSKVDKDGNPIRDNGKFQVDDTKKSVTFQSKTDSDKIIDAIKSMVEDYNSMMSEIKSAYSTMPYQKSNGAFGNYEPLTDEDREGMSESAIERYEEKAKQGILFGDRNLSNLYSRMLDAFSFTSTNDVDTLKDMGISVGYDISGGGSSIQIDEDKLRAALDSDPDRVANLFTKTDGIMDRMKTELDYYSKTTGEPKGVLIQQAGSPLSSLSLMNNTWQQQIDNINEQIEKWQDKMSNQVDRYTQQFSRLEQLINQMNSQSSALAGLMGGG